MNQSKFKKFLKSRVFLIIALLIVMLVVAYCVAPKQFSTANLKQILNNLSWYLVIGTGVACLMLSGGIDFATAAHASLAITLFALCVNAGPNVPWVIWAVVLALFGCFFGGVNAFLTQKLGMMPFIATIGMTSIWSGAAQWITEGDIVTIANKNFQDMATIYYGGIIPAWFVFAVVVCFIYNFILTRTRFGRSITMVGGNANAARLAGINPVKIRTLMFINNGFLASMGGMIWASQQKQASPSGLTSAGPEMTALTSVMLGGVAFGGGSGSLVGAFLGILLIQVVAYALQAMNTQVWLLTLINGSLLVIALTIDRIANKASQAAVGMPGMSK